MKRSIVHGPTVFIPEVTQWLHVFRWHGSPAGGDQGAKVPGALVFTKLRTIPDQFYCNAQVGGGTVLSNGQGQALCTERLTGPQVLVRSCHT